MSGVPLQMCENDTLREIGKNLVEAARKQRPYAGFFTWPNRDTQELGIARTFLAIAATSLGVTPQNLRSRGTGHDPPDCEFEDQTGRLIGIEITELVDQAMIQENIRQPGIGTAQWDVNKLTARLEHRLRVKDTPDRLKGGPYHQYLLLIHVDEPELPIDQLRALLTGVRFSAPRLIDRAFILTSYDPRLRAYPYVELQFEGDP